MREACRCDFLFLVLGMMTGGKTHQDPVSEAARRLLGAVVLPAQQLRQLGEVRGQPPRLVAGQPVGRGAAMH